ncbi:MAG TPA: membrane protein insertion efficiency factor YidD [Vicinamibacterales bacterium]
MPTSAPLKPTSDTPCAGPSDDPAQDSSAGRLSVPARGVLAAVRGYQLLLSPLFRGSCRFIPSCSEYMVEAVRRHGALRGGWLGVWRILRCQPLCAHGLDPVPDTWPRRRDNDPRSDFPAQHRTAGLRPRGSQ